MSQVNSVNGNTLLFTGFFPPCRAATAGSPVTLAGLSTLDGVALNAGDRVLVKDQADQTTNGVYAAGTGNWVRTSDALSNTQFFDGMAVTVALGTQNAATLFICTTTDDPVIIGTSHITFASLSTINTVSAAMRPVVQAATIPAAVTAMGIRQSFLSGVRLFKSGAYAASAADIGSTLALGGAAYYAVSFGHASAFPAPWYERIVNEDTSRAKCILLSLAQSSSSLAIGTGSKAFTVPSGLDAYGNRFRAWSTSDPSKWMAGTLASYTATTMTLTIDTTSGAGTFGDFEIAPEVLLYPRQSVVVENQNNVWKIYDRAKWQVPTVPGAAVLYVDTGGSDSNDGLAPVTQALRNIGTAVQRLYQDMDHNLQNPTILVAAGQTFNEHVQIVAQLAGVNVLNIQGNGGNFTWQNNATCLGVGDNGEVILNGVNWQGNQLNAVGIGHVLGHNNAVIDFIGSHVFTGAGSNDTAIFLDGLCVISTTNGFTVSGTFGDVVYYQAGGKGSFSGVIGPSGSPTAARLFNLNKGAVAIIGTQPTASGYASLGATLVDACSVLSLNGTTMPGGAITPTHGGQAF